MNKIFKGIIVGLRYVKNKNYRKWIDEYDEPTSFSFEQKGTELYGNIIYLIGMEDLGGCEKTMGFFALFNCVLNRLYYADRLGLIPYVHYPNTVLYFDKEHGDNAWEYYFKAVSDVQYEEIKSASNLAISKEKDSQFNLKGRPGYELDDNGIVNLAVILKKYIRVNENMQRYLDEGIDLLDIENTRGGGIGRTY